VQEKELSKVIKGRAHPKSVKKKQRGEKLRRGEYLSSGGGNGTMRGKGFSEKGGKIEGDSEEQGASTNGVKKERKVNPISKARPHRRGRFFFGKKDSRLQMPETQEGREALNPREGGGVLPPRGQRPLKKKGYFKERAYAAASLRGGRGENGKENLGRKKRPFQKQGEGRRKRKRAAPEEKRPPAGCKNGGRTPRETSGEGGKKKGRLSL